MTECNDDLVQEVVDGLRSFVVETEAGVATTRNHYGEYMSIIMAVDGVDHRRAVAAALISVGANKQGVGDALRLAV